MDINNVNCPRFFAGSLFSFSLTFTRVRRANSPQPRAFVVGGKSTPRTGYKRIFFPCAQRDEIYKWNVSNNRTWHYAISKRSPFSYMFTVFLVLRPRRLQCFERILRPCKSKVARLEVYVTNWSIAVDFKRVIRSERISKTAYVKCISNVMITRDTGKTSLESNLDNCFCAEINYIFKTTQKRLLFNFVFFFIITVEQVFSKPFT